jgi:signal transduction histidine kinase
MTGMVGLTWPVPRRPWVRAAAQVGALELLVVGGTFAVEAGGRRPPDAAGYLLLALAAGATGLSRWSPLGALGVTLAAALAYVGRGGSEHGPLVLAVMAALYAAVLPEHPWRTVVIGAATVLGFHIVADASSAASVHAVGDASAAAASHAVGAASSAAGGLVASFVSRSGWIAVPLVLGHAVASARGHRASAEERARLAEQTREEHAQRRVAEERLRIARELHDVVSHSISVINLQAGVALHVIDQQPEQARSALIAIKGTSKETLRELRGILGLLRKDEDAEPREPAPGLDQLDALIEATTRVGVPTRLSIEGQSRRLSPAVELTAYRIVQESLTNVLQHAGRASAAVTLRYEDDRIAIDVADDGRGAVPGDGAGLGVVGMRERASAVGGGLEAGPDAAGGFRVSAWLPAPRDAP